MADKIQILIEAILQKTSKENLEKELQQIQDKLKPLEVKTDIKQASQELQKFAQTFVQVEGSSEKLIKETEQYKNSLGQIVKEIRNIQEVTDEQGNVQQKISSTIKTITTDYQKQRQELEKINAEQSKYWSQRVKETVSDMTRKPDELVKMADYYKQLEQESAKLAQMDEKREQAELEYWSKRRKEAVEAITQTNTELVKMREYYSELEKVSAKENVRVFNLGTNLTDKTSGFTGVDRESAERYAKEIYGADAAVTKFNQTMDKNGKIVSDATVRVNKNSKEYTEYRMKLDEATKSVNQFGEAINRKTGKDMGIFEQFRVALERFPVWIVSATLFMGAIHKIQEGISFIEDMNKVFTNLQMEMTNANLNFKEITKTANDYAIAMGTTTEQVMKAIGVFSTYTSTIDEVLQKSKAAIILSNITGQNIEQSSDQLMGTMEQFDMSAESSMHVVDIIAGTARMLQVDYPQAVQQISDGLRTVGSVAKESKISVEELSSMIGTLVEKTRRSGTEVSNALKTIFSRMSRTGDDSNFSNIEKALNKIGIAMRSDVDTIRPMNDILSDLALKWKTLTDVQKENIAQEAAGVYRRNYFIALMNNYNDVLKNTDAAINSNGVAMQKQEIYSNSLQAATQRLTAEWEKFYLGIIKSDYIRTAVSGLSSFIEIINRTTTGLGGLKTALMLLTTGVIIKFVSSLYSAAAGAGILETAIVALQLGVKGLSAALLGLVTNPVTLLVTALVAIPVGIMAWTNAQQKLKEQLEATTKAQNDFNKAHQEFNKSLDPNKINEEAQALEELKKALNYDEATKKVEELQNKINKLQENIKKGDELGFDTSTYRDALVVYENELSKYEGTIKKVSDTEKQYNKDKELSIALDYESAQQKAKSIALKVQEANSNIQVANSYKTVYDKLVNGIALTQEETQLNEKLIQQYPQHVELLNKKTGAIGVNLQALTSNVNLQKQLAEVEFNEYKLSIQANAEKTKQLIDETQKRVIAIQAEIDSLDVLINKYNDLINSGKGDLVTEKLGIRAFQRQDSLRQSLVDAQNQLTKLKATNSAYDSVLNANYEDLLKGSSSGYMSGTSGKSGSSASEIDVKEALVTKDRYFELNQELEKTNILLTKNKALQENADYQTKIKLMDEEINLLKQKQVNLHLINEERRKERDELVKTLSESGINFTGEGDNITPTNGAAVLQAKADEVNAHRFDKDKTLYKQLKEEFDDLQTAYNRFFEVYKDIGNTSNDWLEVQKAINGINTDKLKSASEEIKKITDSLNDYKNDLQDLMNTEEKAHQNRLDAIEEEKKAFDDYIDDKLSKLEREKEAQDYSNDINDLTEELNKLQQERTKYSMAAASGDSEALSKISYLDEQIAEKKKSISEKQSDREYQLRKENLQDIKNKQDEEYDSQKDTENKKYEAMKETYDKLKTDIENFAQAGINANSTMVDSIIADYNNLAAQFGSSTQKMASVFASSFLSKLQEAKNQLTQIKSQLGITNTSSNSSKTIEDYQADYIAAKAAGNWQAMEAANKAANKLRGLVDSSGEGIVTAIEDIKNVRGYATGTDDVLSLVGEHGAELRVLNPNGKDSIIPNGLTANLVNFAKNPIDFMSNIMSSFTFNIPKIASVGNSGYGDIILNVSMPVYGNVDQSTANTITNNFATTLKSTLTKAGIINR